MISPIFEKSYNYIEITPYLDGIQVNSPFPKNSPKEDLNNKIDIKNDDESILSESYVEKEILENDFKKEIEKIKNQSIKKEENLLFKNSFISDGPVPFPNQIKLGLDEKSQKSTKDKTKKNANNIDKCLFGLNSTKDKEARTDYAIKNIKVYISKFLKNEGNKLIKNCGFGEKLKNKKLFAISYKYFTGNSNEKNNNIFLDFTVEKIFTYPDGKIQKNDYRLQKQNKQIIEDFKEYIQNKFPETIPEKFQKLLDFFNMTFHDAIIQFYNSKDFEKYCSDKKTIFLDNHFQKVKTFSLLEKNGFLRLIAKK